MRIIEARSAAEIDAVRALFREYAEWLQVDLCFQSFEQELATLPGKYDCLLLLVDDEGDDDGDDGQGDGGPCGCAGVRGLTDGACELKRLYVREAAQGGGWGRRLLGTAIQNARDRGYRAMRLDTITGDAIEGRMDRAIALYRRTGFREIEPYYDNPIQGARYFELILNP